MSKPEIGDIVVVETRNGLAYAQYTHKKPMYGALIRIFDKIYQEAPADLSEVLNQPVRFSIFFPLTAALSKGICKVVANEQVPTSLKEFPVFRAGIPNPTTKKVDDWWLWNGDQEVKVGKLTQDQLKLPIRGVWNDTLLVDRIESGWRPEFDSRN